MLARDWWCDGPYRDDAIPFLVRSENRASLYLDCDAAPSVEPGVCTDFFRNVLSAKLNTRSSETILEIEVRLHVECAESMKSGPANMGEQLLVRRVDGGWARESLSGWVE